MSDKETTGPYLFRSFREQLLGPTIKHAVENSHFYQSLFGDSWNQIRTIEDLRHLPTTGKRIMRLSPIKEILTSKEKPYLTQHTSGTTDQPFHVYRSRQEVEFIQAFFSERKNQDTSRNIAVFSLKPAYHGDPISIPVKGEFTNINILEEDCIENLISKLKVSTSSFGDDRIGILSGIFHHVRYLTVHLMNSRFDFSQSGVKAIFITGQHVTHRWRRLLEQYWVNVPIVNRFSLTEGFGGATQCNQCGLFHFDQYCIPEVLDLNTNIPLSQGVGILHITSLFPFVQLMPFIRYRTNDLVRIVPCSCKACDGNAIELLGRWDHCGAVRRGKDTKVIIASTRLFEFLDEVNEVNTDNEFDNQTRIRDLTYAGNPKFRFSISETPPAVLQLLIELRFPPQLYPDAIKPLKKRIIEGVRKRNPGLQELEKNEPVTWNVDFLAPGTLKAFDPSSVPDSIIDEKN
ncbi:MAG: hypothetical protein JRE64_00535 [Deltaproteobacteria bacterium]|nr:hypothetical protein [Deltaproteobacteria bacterium]